MLPHKRTTTHPGEVLQYEFLEPLEVSQSEFARHLNIPIQRVNELIRGKRGVTPSTAWLLSKALGTTPEFWMNLQVAYELSSIEPPKGIKRLVA
ncbi:HigA family addiction module antitoxin [bacterium]|nr:HigA family addiction module antitoxin [bacterium]